MDEETHNLIFIVDSQPYFPTKISYACSTVLRTSPRILPIPESEEESIRRSSAD